MQRVSSQFTIILRVVLPTIWITSIISLVVLLSWAVQGKASIWSHPSLWIAILVILGCGFAFIKFLLWKFYRIDLDSRSVYVSNYFKTFKYPHTDIESIKGTKFYPGHIFRITLKSKGSFGKQIYFLASRELWLDYLKEHPEFRLSYFNPDTANS
jgi:hypothetical protein